MDEKRIEWLCSDYNSFLTWQGKMRILPQSNTRTVRHEEIPEHHIWSREELFVALCAVNQIDWEMESSPDAEKQEIVFKDPVEWLTIERCTLWQYIYMILRLGRMRERRTQEARELLRSLLMQHRARHQPDQGDDRRFRVIIDR